MDNTRVRLAKELAAARAKENEYISRPGIAYSRGASNLDAGIADRRNFAVRWRKAALELPGTLTMRKVKVVSRFENEHYSFTVLSSDGVDQFAVELTAGPNFIYRWVQMEAGETAEEALKRDGFKIEGGQNDH